MDAPPSQENCVPFVQVAQLFKAAGVHVPEILAQDLAQGFLLLSDLGSETYLAQLNANSADDLYRDANNALIKIQLASQPNRLPHYDAAHLLREMRLFSE